VSSRPVGHPAVDRLAVPVLMAIPFALCAALVAFFAARQAMTVLVLVAALTALAVCTLKVEVALLLLVVLGPLESAFSTSGASLLSPSKVAGIVCFGSFVLNALASRRRLEFDRSHVLVVLLLVVALISAVQAENATEAFSTTIRYGSFVALYVVLTQFVGDRTFQRRLAWALSLSAALAGLLAIEYLVSGEGVRATLPYGDPNDFAYGLAVTLPLAFWLLTERPLLRPVVIAAIGLISAAVFLSFSRGAVLALAAGAIWHVIAHRRHVFMLTAGAAVAIIVTALFVESNPEKVQSAFELKQKANPENVESRLEAWRGAAELAVSHPVLGVGPGNLQFHYQEALGIPPGAPSLSVAHNAFFDVAADLGLIALGLFLAYLVTVFAHATIAHRESRGPPGYAAAVRTSLVIAVVGALPLSVEYQPPLWLFGALATVIWAEGRTEESS
jgi:O-antigen ligase